MDEFKIIDQLNNSKGYDIALFTTFNFDIRYFDRAIVRALENFGVKKISVFVDRDELNEAVHKAPDSDIGKKYVVNPIEINGAFHPKVILLLGKKSAKLIVMSANLTVSGLCTNREIFNDFTYNEGSLENIGLIRSAIDFFLRLHELSWQEDKQLFDEIRRLPYYHTGVPKSESLLMHNLSSPIFTQLTEVIRDVQSIDIAVPFYDNNLTALSRIKEQFPIAEIRLYLQNRKSRISFDKACALGITPYIFDKTEDNSGFYHGKVFRFTTADREYILYGSANCTASAMLKTHSDGGNIECDILETGELGEFDDFFELFSPCPEAAHSFLPLDYAPARDDLFYFRCGRVENDAISLVIGCHELPSPLNVLWNGDSVDYIIDDHALCVSLPYARVIDTDARLSIELRYRDKIEIIDCWYIDTILLSANREKEHTGILYQFSPYSTGSKFYQDMTALLKWSSMTEEELQDEERIYALLHADTKEADPENEDSDEEDDGIVSYTIPTAVDAERDRLYETARSCCTTIIRDYFARGHSEASGVSPVTSTTPHVAVPLSEEKRFVRFVKSRVNSILKPEFIARDDFKRYWSGTHIFFNIFDKYYTFESHRLFTEEYIVETKAKLLSALLQKPYGEEYDENMKIMVFRTITEGYLMTDIDTVNNQKTKKLYRYLVSEMDKRYDMRESYQEYVQLAFFSALQRSNVAEFGSIIHSIDSLFTYLPINKIFKRIVDVHGSTCKESEAGDRIIIYADTNDITSFMNLNRILKYLNPLADYARAKGTPTSAFITVTNTKIYPGKQNYTKRITYHVDLLKREYRRTLTRATGKSDAPIKGKF